MEANINYLLKKLWLRREARSNTTKRWADSLPCSSEGSVGISSGCHLGRQLETRDVLRRRNGGIE